MLTQRAALREQLRRQLLHILHRLQQARGQQTTRWLFQLRQHPSSPPTCSCSSSAAETFTRTYWGGLHSTHCAAPHLPHPLLKSRQLQLLRQLLGRAVAVVARLHHHKWLVRDDLQREAKGMDGEGWAEMS